MSTSTSTSSSSPPIIKDVSAAAFATDVLERSRALPVVVDFWAAWCAPCRVLGPILEAEVKALDGKLELAKVDTDADPTLAAEYGIQGIPAVKAFRDGRVVSEFVGARPAAFIRSWLAALVPSPALQELERAEQAARAGDRAGAEPVLRRLLVDADGEPALDRQVGARALAALVRVLLDADDLAGAEQLLGHLDARGDAAELAEPLRARLRLLQTAAAAGGRAGAEAALARDPSDREARYALGAALAAAGETEAALQQFLDLAAAARRARGDDARRAMLAIFDQLGADSDLARDYRRRLQIVS
ncbi:MAG TPA: tetratricopeptide repeat protein [Polyangia bacterium]|nr:tetratricopeptide repeat protein [Polyangia bacterium]